MDIITITTALGTLIVTIVGVTIALMQLRAGRHDAHAARVAELSWQIYQTYESPEIRTARMALEDVSHVPPVPQSGEQYGQLYVLKTQSDENQGNWHSDKESISISIRRILRFYHQIGILMDKGLIDPDFVFPLIGAGLETSSQGIKVATEWYQNYYGGVSGHEKVLQARTIYQNALKLSQQYASWKQAQNK